MWLIATGYSSRGACELAQKCSGPGFGSSKVRYAANGGKGVVLGRRTNAKNDRCQYQGTFVVEDLVREYCWKQRPYQPRIHRGDCISAPKLTRFEEIEGLYTAPMFLLPTMMTRLCGPTVRQLTAGANENEGCCENVDLSGASYIVALSSVGGRSHKM